MNNKSKTLSAKLLFVFALLLSACEFDHLEGWQSHERAITEFSFEEGQIGIAEINRAESKITVQVKPNAPLESMKPIFTTSYKSTVSPASGELVNFKAGNNTATFTVTSESGQTRDWTVELVPFVETLLGTFEIADLVVYGGTGPEYGGAASLPMMEKHWAWPAAGGPGAELDNTLTFAFTDITEDNNTHGTFINHAGDDGLYADFRFVMNPETDVNHFYRKIPKGEGTWFRDYTANTVTFTGADGTTSTAALVSPGTRELGNNQSRTLTNQAFEFVLQGTDDWVNIYSDYDKFVMNPRRFWVEVKKVE